MNMAKIDYFPDTHKSDTGVTFTLEDSQAIAILIQTANALLFQIDLDYLNAAAKEVRRKASLYDATAPLNSQWNEHGGNVLDKQADALETLARYIQQNKNIDTLRIQMSQSAEKKADINKLFFE